MKKTDKEDLVQLLAGFVLMVVGAIFLSFSWGAIPGLICLGLGVLLLFLLSPFI